MQLLVAQRFWIAGLMGWNDDRGIIARVPLIYRQETHINGEIALMLRWNGDDEIQREFQMSMSPKRLKAICHLEPDLFRPVLIGQFKDLPSGSLFHRRAVKYYECEGDDWIMLAVAPFPSGRKERERAVPAHFVSRVVPAKVSAGYIEPARYINMNPWYEAEKEINPPICKFSPIKSAAYQKMGVLL